jgi:hypothetical protein
MTATFFEAILAAATAILWGLIIVYLHFIKPQLTPAAHTISEYARAPKGWIMQIAFCCMTVSCLSLALAGWPYLHHPGLVLLAIIGVGFAGAGIFVTDAHFITEGNLTPTGILHVAFASVVIPFFPVMATLLSVNMDRIDFWRSFHSLLLVLAGMTWVGCAGFVWAIMRSAGGRAGQGADIPVGYYQRFMIFWFTMWIITASLAMAVR